MSDREINLKGYIPFFMREYGEIKELLDAENPEFQLQWDESERLKDDLFILTCDEDGISRFEKMLHITPNPDDSLQARISRVITRWNDALPYTYKSLLQKLDVLCGAGNYQVIPDFNNYEMTVIAYLPLAGQTSELDYLLSYIVPANILVHSSNVIVHNVTGNLFTAGGTVTHRKFTIDSKMNTEHILQGTLKGSGTVVRMVKRTIETATT
jgi:hypothetical protein